MTESEQDFLRIVHAIRKARQAVVVYLSGTGHPTVVDGVGCTRVGTYTKGVTIGQLEDDIAEADRERRARW